MNGERKMSNKLRRKVKSSGYPMNVANFTLNQISDMTKCRVDSLKFWCEAREKEIEDIYQKEAREKLEKAEDYIAVANILITLVAIKMTWGYTKANQRLLENYNAATEYVTRNGIEKTYQELQKQMGIELEFDSMDINREFGFGE